MSSSSDIPDVAVVVLTWNRLEDTLACLASLADSDWRRRTTIVVDNASDQPVQSAISERFPEVTVIRTQENLGFAGGMNVGLRRALENGAEYVLLLNNDTLVERSMLRRLIEVAASDPLPGIVSPLVLAVDSNAITSAGTRFDPRRGHPGRPLLAGTSAHDHLEGIREVDASSGEAMLASSEAVRAVGLLDESLYLRLEDVDWSLRMRAAGRHNFVVLDARLWHGVSSSSGGEHSALTAFYHTRNILVVCDRHAPLSGPRRLAREAEVLLANLLHARRGEHPIANARAVVDGWLAYRRGRTGAR